MKSLSRADFTRKSLGGIAAVVGFLLSPLSWWNDLVVNVPLALVFAWLVSFFYPSAFATSFVVGYWLTNILGMVLMHFGATAVVSKGPPSYSRKQIIRDFVIALFYTALIVTLVKLRVLAPLPTNLLHR
jgi:hypothetical protein